MAPLNRCKVTALGLGDGGYPMAPQRGSPQLVLLFSGKRKSGKDFVTERLRCRCLWGGEEEGMASQVPLPEVCALV